MARTRETDAHVAVRAVYDAHYGRLAGWAKGLLGDPDIAHDLATEAFMRLVRDWDRVDEPKAWLYTVTGNLIRDHWRKRGREAAAYARHEAGSDRDVVSDPDTATTITVRDAIQSLPDRLRLPVMLYYYADLPVGSVAHQLGKSDGTIKRDLFEARKRLAVLLEGAR
ncbi:RNA polymerase sigma factor [Janibacter sp. GXQ6167]|uniref:RNA polymerase sigma factor n=1 Tax=Janibacter sp. GXQ6167 TaxID=3240791 RepID=UPI003526A053